MTDRALKMDFSVRSTIFYKQLHFSETDFDKNSNRLRSCTIGTYPLIISASDHAIFDFWVLRQSLVKNHQKVGKLFSTTKASKNGVAFRGICTAIKFDNELSLSPWKCIIFHFIFVCTLCLGHLEAFGRTSGVRFVKLIIL